jgi:hypothetical protein
MDWVTFQGTGFENKVSGGVYTYFSLFSLVDATVRPLTLKVSLLGRGTGINSKHKGVHMKYLYYSSVHNATTLLWTEL